MKKALLYSAFALATLTTATSCGDSFLTLDPVGAVTETSLSDKDGMDKLLAGAYATLYSQDGHNWGMGYMGLSNWMFGDVIGGEGNKGSSASDQPDASNLEQWVIDPSNPYLLEKWTAIYEGVKRANNVLKVAAMMDGGATQYEAEARFIKGVHMFEAIKIFGAHVPYVTLEDFLASADPVVTNMDESGNLIYVWDKVAEDLQFAADNLPDSYDPANKGHINKWAAKAMLAKLYMFKGSPYSGKESNGANDASAWAKAKSLLEEVIGGGKTSDGTGYGLADSYAQLFTPEGDWTAENVFDVQIVIEGTSWYPATINGSHAPYPRFIPGSWGFFNPSYEFVNSFIVDEKGLPAANYRDHKPLVWMSDDGVNAVSDLDTYVDPRLDMTIGRFSVPYYWVDAAKDGWGIPGTDQVELYCREANYSGLFWAKKYVPMQYEQGVINDCPGATNKNLHVMRYAEVLLLRAECAIHENDLVTAQKYINDVRDRAAKTGWWAMNSANPHTGEVVGGKTVKGTAANYRIGLYPPFTSADEAMTALKREIRLENGMEGKHWFNLTRWGNVANDLNGFAEWENQYMPKYINKYSNDWITLPFPYTEVVKANGRLKQNAVWQ
ncbi:MAG: RagB/SusD family nutrient uptake outer membrane protein [Bacteroidaceae bacterium]|nr:RagB/SusD family nutrient uptake outer membrane protein [Bacteroidaceae bacterium]